MFKNWHTSQQLGYMHIVRIYSHCQVFPQKGNAPQFPVAICLYMTAVFHNYFIAFLCIIDKLTPLNFSYNVTQKTLRGKTKYAVYFLKFGCHWSLSRNKKDRIFKRLVIQSFYSSWNISNWWIGFYEFSQYSNLRRYLPVWCNQDVALKSSNSFVNLCVSSRPFVPLYKLTCDSQLVCSSYNPSIFSPFVTLFLLVSQTSGHSAAILVPQCPSSLLNLEWTFANILTRYLCTVDFPVPWRHNLKIFIMLQSVISSLHVGW